MKKIFYILLVMMFSFTLNSCSEEVETGESDEMEMKEEATNMVDEATEAEKKVEGKEDEMEKGTKD